jgi:hypothetical protein
VYPYGYDKAQYYKETKPNRKKIMELNRQIHQEYKTKIEKLQNKNLSKDTDLATLKKQNSKVKEQVFGFFRKFGKMWLTISMILSYCWVYHPRSKSLENYQFLNSIDVIEGEIVKWR